jgi:predicted nucleic acid-binding protein
MNYLLDTCVISEFTRRQPDERIIRWLDSLDEAKLFLSVFTIGEIQHGIERLPDSRRKNELMIWLNVGLIERFSGRILALDVPTLVLWGTLIAHLEASGQPMSVMDSLIAASALHNNLILVTRNTADFVPCGVQLLNPWE